MEVKKVILKKLEELEKRHNFKVLFCVESGSRVWGMESKDSDYDVRFVFYRPVRDYIRTNKRGETVHVAYNSAGQEQSAQGALYDFQGFDITKFSNMLYNSNPTVIEWLKSDIVYYGIKPEEWVEFAETCFKPMSLYCHYKSMGKQNFIKYIKTGNLVTWKKYLYVMRGIINAQYVAMFDKVPPIKFEIAVDQVDIPDEIKGIIYEIIRLKKFGGEMDEKNDEVELDAYIENYLKDDSDKPENKQMATPTELDKVLYRVLEI